MRKMISLQVMLSITCIAYAQSSYDFKGKFFGFAGAGYRIPIKKYFGSQPLDGLLTLKSKTLSINATHFYFIKKNWGVFLDMQFGTTAVKHYKIAATVFERYQQDYYFDIPDINNSAQGGDDRLALGPSFRYENNRWRLFSSLGLGFIQFKGIEYGGIRLKEKNTNIYHKLDLLFNEHTQDDDVITSFVTSGSIFIGYRLSKRTTVSMHVNVDRFKPNIEYRLERTNLYTQERFIDQKFDYRRSAVELTASAGIIFTPSIDRRDRLQIKK